MRQVISHKERTRGRLGALGADGLRRVGGDARVALEALEISDGRHVSLSGESLSDQGYRSGSRLGAQRHRSCGTVKLWKGSEVMFAQEIEEEGFAGCETVGHRSTGSQSKVGLEFRGKKRARDGGGG